MRLTFRYVHVAGARGFALSFHCQDISHEIIPHNAKSNRDNAKNGH